MFMVVIKAWACPGHHGLVSKNQKRKAKIRGAVQWNGDVDAVKYLSNFKI